MEFAVEVKSKIFSLLSLIPGNDFADFSKIILDLHHYNQGQSQIRNVS